jgi:phage tail sheath protein FI
MASRTLISPGVEVRETDLSLIAPQNIGTTVFVPGFAPRGYSDEVIKISSRSELEDIYGTPTNSAERYFYYTVRELLNSPANIYTFRLPYGSGLGDGFGSQHTALIYPVVAATPTATSTTRSLDLSAGTYFLGKPYQINLSEAEFAQAVEGSLFQWSSTAAETSAFEAGKPTALANMGGAGLVILDKAQTTINSQFEGYYVAIADNININPASNFDAITRAYTTSLTASVVTDYTLIPNGTLQFNLSATSDGPTNSISQVMENLTNYNIDGREDDDLLNVGVFKLRKSQYATEAFKLDYVLDDRIVGSIDTFRTQLNPNGGPSVPFFLESQDTNSRNLEILVNPYISNKFTQSALDSAGLPRKKIRVVTESLLATNYASISAALGVTTTNLSGTTTVADTYALSGLNAAVGTANALYPLGAYTPVQITQKIIGNLPSKINRALESVKNDEIYDIDIVVEGGLGTIYTMSDAAGTNYYDDTLYNTALKTKLDTIRTSQDISNDNVATDLRAKYSAIFNQFENFCNLPSNTGGRGDCVVIADPIRHIMVTGRNTKILSDRTKNFQTDVYWAIRHQFELENTSYAATYGNWVKGYDDFTGEMVWLPFSGYQAAIMARSDAAEFPWSAPAGFTRGLVTNALDIAINPNQKQRDELYKININPVMFSAAQGVVVFGQKTMSRKPSAFDRINVRRLFLALERPTKKASQYFVFEPNNEFTWTRMKNVLTPIFEFAKNNGGLYDYLIVIDERVNTPEVIDNNELKATFLLKPTRTAEFILLNFVATRTDANFEELI